MAYSEQKNSRIIDGTALGISLMLLAASLAGALYTGTGSTLWPDFFRILTSPGPLITDYFGIGSLPAAFLNAGLCGLVMWAFMAFLPGPSHVNTFAGYFLVVAHAFYGLNFLNMWPCFLGPFLYIKIRRLDYNQNLHICMLCTCFSPFVSELLFRYAQGDAWSFGEVSLSAKGIILTLLLTLVLAFVAPALLPGTKAWHKGYNLYNGGLAFGMLGFFLFTLLYRTMGVGAPASTGFNNRVYEEFGNSYRLFCCLFFLLLFACCLGAGYWLNGKSFKGLSRLFTDTGYESNFASRYGMPLCLINIGIYGIMFLVYVFLAERFTSGAGFTGPTVGVIFAALTFSSMGQHPRNVWPIFAGYVLLFLLAEVFNHFISGDATWTLSTQIYINSVAFATGLCPLVGRYGVFPGILAGMLCASLTPATAALHGGLMLYNGGFTAGIATLILLPLLEHYLPNPRASMNQHIDLRDMMTFSEAVKKDEEEDKNKR